MPGAAEGVPEVIVVDASAVVALVASRAEAASRIVTRVQGAMLHAPHILPTEVDSALRGLALGNRLSHAQADAARLAAASLPIDLWPWELLADRAWELRENLTTYDAGYVALAERLDASLVTADRRLAGAPGVHCPIEVFGR